MLAEAYRRTGDEWQSNKLLDAKLAEVRRKLDDPEDDDEFADRDWGDTLSLVEVRARAQPARSP